MLPSPVDRYITVIRSFPQVIPTISISLYRDIIRIAIFAIENSLLRIAAAYGYENNVHCTRMHPVTPLFL